MNTYRFRSHGQIVSLEAKTYKEALAALVFQVGSEADASRFIFMDQTPIDERDKLFERALSLIMDEWGKTREEALEWLADDAGDWDVRPRPDTPTPPNAFMQVTRETKLDPPMGWTGF